MRPEGNESARATAETDEHVSDVDRLRRMPLRFLKSPVFPGDPEKTLQGEILLFWLLLLFVGYGAGFIYLVRSVDLLTTVRYTVGPATTAMSGMVLIRQGRVKTAGILISYGMQICLMYSTYHAGGVTATGISAMVIPLIIAGFILDVRSLLGLFVGTVIFLFVVSWRQASGLLPPSYYQPSPFQRAIVSSMVTGSIGAVVWWSTRRIERGRQLLMRESVERKAAERKVRILNRELERRARNRTADLDSFVTMVAHDLRTPVIHVKSYAKLLDEKGEVFDEEAKFFVSRLASTAKNLSELIDGLVELSDRRQGGLNRSSIDMTQIVESVRLELFECGVAENDWISIESLPPAVADPSLVRELWMNLLENAAKFSQPRPKPEIRVYSESNDGQVWYTVKDNGVGFSETDLMWVVRDSTVLKDESDLATEVHFGLFTVKRIVERHGGQIVAEGRPGEGARFSFTLPDFLGRETDWSPVI